MAEHQRDIDKRLQDALTRASAILDIHSRFAVDCQNALSDYEGDSQEMINRLAQNIFEAGKLVAQWAGICYEIRRTLGLSNQTPDAYGDSSEDITGLVS